MYICTYTSPQKAVGTMRLPLSLIFPKLDKHRVLSHSSQDIPSCPVTSFVALLWTYARTLTSFLSCVAQNFSSCSRWDLTNAEDSGTIISSAWMVLLCWTPLCWMVCPLGCQGILLGNVELLQASTPRSLSAGLLSSQSSPSLYLCSALLHPKCRIQHWDLLNFIPLTIAQWLSRFLFNASFPEKVSSISQFGTTRKPLDNSIEQDWPWD